LLLVGSFDTVVLAFNQRAYARLPADKQLVIIPAATHLFEEPGALEEVACHAGRWFARYLWPQPASTARPPAACGRTEGPEEFTSTAALPEDKEEHPMSTTSHALFSNTLQKTHLWLHEVQGELGWEDASKASLALKATLHALRDRLTMDEVAHLGAQLPMLIRGMYYEGWSPAGKPLKERSKAAFLTQVQAYFRAGELDTEPIVRGVFKVLAKHVTAGELDDVKQMLAPEVRQLWP
jgi:uncharacterized protein (DUF2267 family)